MEIPNSFEINTAGLSAVFKKVTNSYKYFWLWAILDELTEKQTDLLSYSDLAMRMVSLVWYPLDYYKLSFGKQDSFKMIASKISSSFTVDNTINSQPLLFQIRQNLERAEAEKLVNEVTETLKRYVSYRFLSSFLPKQNSGTKDHQVNALIAGLSNQGAYGEQLPYKIEKTGIRINGPWLAYFETHHMVLKGFIKWNLVQYLQKNNPYVVGLSEKLEKPILRDLALAKGFWRKYLTENLVTCIYSHVPVTMADLSLDHFIPWSYVAHDRIWNIIPTNKSVNSAKNNSLPSLHHYFDGYCSIQYDALKFHFSRGAGHYLDDFQSIIDLDGLHDLSLEQFREKLRPDVQNNIRTAKNLGFAYPFIYESPGPVI